MGRNCMRTRDGHEEVAGREHGGGLRPEAPAGGERDVWPAAHEEQNALLAKLDRVERRRLRRLESDPLRRAQIVDWAMDIMLRRMRQGELPEHPRAWFRKVVSRLTWSERIPYPLKHLRLDLVGNLIATEQCSDSSSTNPGHSRITAAWLRSKLEKLALSERERAILRAVLDHRSNRAAANALGMGASNFRRDLGKLVEKISPRIRAEAGNYARVFDSLPPS